MRVPPHWPRSPLVGDGHPDGPAYPDPDAGASSVASVLTLRRVPMAVPKDLAIATGILVACCALLFLALTPPGGEAPEANTGVVADADAQRDRVAGPGARQQRLGGGGTSVRPDATGPGPDLATGGPRTNHQRTVARASLPKTVVTISQRHWHPGVTRWDSRQ